MPEVLPGIMHVTIPTLSSPHAACCDISRTNKDVDGRNKSGHDNSLCVLFVLSLCLKARNFRLEDGASRLSPGPDGKALHPHFPLVPAEAGTQFSFFCKIQFRLSAFRAPRFVGLKVHGRDKPGHDNRCGDVQPYFRM